MELLGRVRADCRPKCIPEVLEARPVNKQVFDGLGNGIIA